MRWMIISPRTLSGPDRIRLIAIELMKGAFGNEGALRSFARESPGSPRKKHIMNAIGFFCGSENLKSWPVIKDSRGRSPCLSLKLHSRMGVYEDGAPREILRLNAD